MPRNASLPIVVAALTALAACDLFEDAQRSVEGRTWQIAGDESQPGPERAVGSQLPALEAGSAATRYDKGIRAPGNFVLLPAGTYLMGSPEDAQPRANNETPHKVTITRSFIIQTTEVTQDDFRNVMDYHPSLYRACGPYCPVEQINWFEAAAYCNKLSDREELERCYSCKGDSLRVECVPRKRFNPIADCKGYRLPTEAEWEYAARAGTSTPIYTGELTIKAARNAPDLEPIAWYSGNSGVDDDRRSPCKHWKNRPRPADWCSAHPVARKRPNRWGLYDMLGNVWEWTHDARHPLPETAVTDPDGPRMGDTRIRRGGCWASKAKEVRVAARQTAGARGRDGFGGFRPARTIGE